MKAGHGVAAGVQDKTLRTFLLDLKQAILGLIDELAQSAVVGSANGSFNSNELLKQDGVVHEAGPLNQAIERASLPGRAAIACDFNHSIYIFVSGYSGGRIRPQSAAVIGGGLRAG
jgi:hypothetical protein